MKRALTTLLALALGSCLPPEDVGHLESNVSAAVRRERATIIRDAARARGITDGALMVAMLAEEETYLSHCAGEFPSCPGPVHADCGGRAVISGGGDGPCSLDQGGLGMFQIDDGTEADTVRVHGARVLSLRGNADVAIDRLLGKIVASHYLGVSTRDEAISFLNALRIDDRNWDAYVRTLVRYWNGCREGARCWTNRYPKYNAAARTLLSEMGREFWYGMPAPPPPSGTGWLASPIGSPRVTSHVSHARSGGGWQRYDCAALTRAGHRGTDFGVAIGTAVRAAAGGSVLRSVTGCSNSGSLSSTCGGSYGNHVILLHDGGFATLYAHLSPDGTQARQGARLACGELVGHSGNSGRSSGPHLHFEVRSGVRDAGTYFQRDNTVDPWGGACSSQRDSLWIGGAPASSCMPAADRDDSVVVSSTYPREVAADPGARLTQSILWRNRGSTTWTSADYLMRHTGGAFGSAREIRLPSGISVAPGRTVRLSVTVTVPSAAGLHRGTWRMSRQGGPSFGQSAHLIVRVAQRPRDCSSSTLGRSVPSGSCVQVSYPGCAASSCAWYRCADGAWNCARESECTADAYAHASCRPPASDAGVPDGGTCTAGSPRGGPCESVEDCCEGLECGADSAGARACCHGRGSLCGSSSECCGSMLCEMSYCGCVPAAQLCFNDGDCCEGLGCLAGACRPTQGCARETSACGGTSDCCWPLSCQRASGGGSNQCCISGGNRCEADAECCGDMRCVTGHCQCRARGESCTNLLDCCGSFLCNGGTCG